MEKNCNNSSLKKCEVAHAIYKIDLKGAMKSGSSHHNKIVVCSIIKTKKICIFIKPY